MPCSSRIGLNSNSSVLFSRSHYKFIIVRATRVFSSERTDEKRVDTPSGAKSTRTSTEAKMAVRGNDGDEGRWCRAAFCRGESEASGEPTWWTEVPGDRTVPGALLRQPSQPGGHGADMRDTVAPRVPLPGFLCASADRPKRVYGTSASSSRKARPARSFTTLKWHYCFTSRLWPRGLHLNAKILIG